MDPQSPVGDRTFPMIPKEYESPFQSIDGKEHAEFEKFLSNHLACAYKGPDQHPCSNDRLEQSVLDYSSSEAKEAAKKMFGAACDPMKCAQGQHASSFYALSSKHTLQYILHALHTESLAATRRHEELLTRLQETHVPVPQYDSKRASGDDESYGTMSNTSEKAQKDTKAKPNLNRDESFHSGESSLDPTCSQMNKRKQSWHSEHSHKVTETLSAKSNLKIGKHRKAKQHPEADRNFTAPTIAARLKSAIKDERFEFCVAGMILANAITLCFEVQYAGIGLGYDLKFPHCDQSADSAWPGAEEVIFVLDWCYGILFFVECVLKIWVFRRAYFVDAWSWLDMVCVFAFAFDKALSTVSPVDGKALRLLRLCRLIRLTRLLRTMETFDALFVMTTTIKGMTQILLWAVALLSVMLMTTALFLAQVLQAYYFSDASAGSLSEADLVTKHRLFEYFGTFTRCMFSMFEVTLANWPPVARLLSEDVSEWFMLLCVMHKITVGFAVVGVINGVILQETFKVAAIDDMIMFRQKQRAVKMMKQKMSALFEALDIDEDGGISFDEFVIISDIPDVRTWLASMEIETDDLETLFTLIDVDRDGVISSEELITRMPRIKGYARGIDVMAANRRLQIKHIGVRPEFLEYQANRNASLGRPQPSA